MIWEDYLIVDFGTKTKKMKVEYIDSMGTDLTVVNAARVSFDKESDFEYEEVELGWGEYDFSYKLNPADTKLIRYLASHNHFTPFTHCTITLRESVPIFVARQRFKHTVGFSYNEVSRRYVDDTPEFYTPDVWRGRPEGSVKQGSSDTAIVLGNYDAFSGTADEVYDNWGDYNLQELYDEHYERTLILYTSMLKAGVAPEQARMVLPQSMYTSYYVTGSLAAFARAYKLRADSHAQREIQDVAKLWDDIIRPLFPVSWSALVDSEAT